MKLMKKFKKTRIFNYFADNYIPRRVLYLSIFMISVVVLLMNNFMPERIDLEEGEVAPSDIRSERYLSFIDEEATEIKREEVRKTINSVYKLDETVGDTFAEEIDEIYGEVFSIIDDDTLSATLKEDKLTALNIELSKKEIGDLKESSESKLNAIKAQLKNIVRKNFENGVNNENLIFTIERITFDIEIIDMNTSYKKLMEAIVDNVRFVPNLKYDKEATEQEIEKEISKIDPVKVVIQKGERIVTKGDVLTKRQIEILTWLGYKEEINIWRVLSGITLFTGVMIFLITLFLKHYRKELYRKDKNLILVMVLMLFALILIKTISFIDFSPDIEKNNTINFLIPVAASTMLLGILLDTKLAIFMAAIISIYVGIITGESAYLFTSFVGGFVGVYRVSKLNQRNDLIKAGFWVGLANVAAITAWYTVYTTSPAVYLYSIGFGFFNGILSSILTIGILPFLETTFNITTVVKLLELFNPNHPLLKRMIIEAPGTYHHSILLGNLAEGAAEAIEANSVLVRVAAAFHDIGKLKRPYFYVENQMGVNPHDKLTPSLSTLVIQAHVKDGVEMAKKHKLPESIAKFIPMHHGTSLIKFFYFKAKETNPDVREEEFRYDGPKPDSKETAILMLADGAEAAVRSIKDPTPQKIEAMVNRIIKDKLDDGQLDETDLTFKDLYVISKTFVRILVGVYHSRIEYPESVIEELEKTKKGAEK